jgi:hypothetical protein
MVMRTRANDLSLPGFTSPARHRLGRGRGLLRRQSRRTFVEQCEKRRAIEVAGTDSGTGMDCCGLDLAQRRTRIARVLRRMRHRALAPKSSASANSATLAWCVMSGT